MQKVFGLIKDEKIDKISFIILLFWTISPIIEYILQACFYKYYTYYFVFSIYFVGLSGIIIYLIYLVKLKKKNKLYIKKLIPEILIITLLLISIISTMLCKDPYLSVFGESHRKEGLIVYIMYIGFLLLASIIKNTKYQKYIFKSIILSAFIITLFPLLNSSFTYVNFTNIFHNTNHYGYYLMINVMLSAFMFIDSNKAIKKALYLLSYIFFIYFLIRNNTFGCYLAIIISFFFLFIYSIIKKYERCNVITLILLFIITSFTISHFDIKIGERINFEDTKGLIEQNFKELFGDIKDITNNDNELTNSVGSGRGFLWKEAINYTLNHPIIGGGMESLKEYYLNVSSKYNVQYNERPHNIILQVSSFIGIPGAIIYVVLIFYIAISNIKIMNHNTFHIMVYFTAMSYFISSMFGNSMYYTSPYFMILLGILIGFRRREKMD